ncbi:glutamate--tRNA ligase [bacterium]|nr:glutamate--tRNA ligase [bacterium]
MIRVRFAPSPTGFLHVGAARTALFNWLFARRRQGQFILRIEDTDVERSSREMSEGIMKGLRWLGLNWDEGPIFQSQRLEVYKEKSEELVKEGKAYYCYCSPEEIQERKKKTLSLGKTWKYDRRCLNLSPSQINQYEAEGRPKAVRFYIQDQTISYKDLIHGNISVKSGNLEDFVLLRADGLPTYHLSVVVDDSEEAITHVIRGDDHISNTPKQILLYQAFRASLPEFAHLPLILGPDKKKLSKRHGVTSVLKFQKEGYLPLALLNFLAQMSWSPGDEERIYSLKEMVDCFSIERLSKGSPVFNQKKLEWLNGQLLSQMKAQEIFPYLAEELKEEGLWEEELEEKRRDWFMKLIDLLKERSRTLRELTHNVRPFLSDEFSYDSKGVEKYLTDSRLDKILPRLKEDFETIENFYADSIEGVLRERAKKEGVRAALLIHALRMLVLGMRVSPGIFKVLEMVGRQKTLQRMDNLMEARRAVEDKEDSKF